MDFTEAMQYIEEKNKLGQRPGLERIKELLRRLGNPQDKVKCLHIAGTNGKGSIFAFLQDVLTEAGCRVGRYISPTIFHYLERFWIDGSYVDEAAFAKALTKVAKQAEEMEQDGYMSPTAFEIETAVAFCLFLEARVEFALVECGMGGLMDGTNVISNPYMTVMAQISRDHMQFLGDTLSEIAYQKAGIIKENGICVCAPQTDEANAVIKKTCEEKNTRLCYVNLPDITVVDTGIDGSHFLYKGKEYFISMPGEFQIINAAVAIEAAMQIGNIIEADETIGREVVIKPDIIRKAIADTKWLGRFTVVRKKPYVIVDGAHNEAAWMSLKNSLHKYFTNHKFIYIIGVLRDKEYHKMVDIMYDTMKYAVTVTPDNARGLENTVLSELITAKGVETVTAANQKDAMEKALAKAAEDDVIVVCGSLSFIGGYMTK
ncbi:MAG: bifunctional folylpolyglutamate synthase/dihydrofolate synthase [Clostridium sp.]|nr:bifunctional folylpolyglutamate synthase/dihydrofolate synthase [Clostridium sp.]MCM1173115.1 bifunctional folylpolyglutamate synthase/dihydrofolate synthase [Clostridium sp.]MCM1208945.1 bifunctional folylpolyglutamate synthase/dihydrofolate synthase [Ruminococcus sp.]